MGVLSHCYSCAWSTFWWLSGWLLSTILVFQLSSLFLCPTSYLNSTILSKLKNRSSFPHTPLQQSFQIRPFCLLRSWFKLWQSKDMISPNSLKWLSYCLWNNYMLPFQYLGLVLCPVTLTKAPLLRTPETSTDLQTCSLSYSCFLKTGHQVVSFCDWIAFR